MIGDHDAVDGRRKRKLMGSDVMIELSTYFLLFQKTIVTELILCYSHLQLGKIVLLVTTLEKSGI